LRPFVAAQENRAARPARGHLLVIKSSLIEWRDKVQLVAGGKTREKKNLPAAAFVTRAFSYSLGLLGGGGSMKIREAIPLVLTSAVGFLFFHSQIATSVNFAASDPGVRGGGADAGGPIPGLTANQQAFFTSGLADFVSVEDVADGLGPTM